MVLCSLRFPTIAYGFNHGKRIVVFILIFLCIVSNG
jgi:hypothetical protein